MRIWAITSIMRILRIAQNLYPEVVGGGSYHIHALSRDQAAMGHDVTVLTVSTDTSIPCYEVRDGYSIVRSSPTVNLVGNEISVGLARELWDRDDYDVLHAHSHLYFSTNLAAIKSHFSEEPLAITNHGLYSQTAPRWLFELYLRTVGQLTFDSSDVVLCYTDEDRERLRSLGVRSQIEVVANGIDTERFTPEGPTDDRIPPDNPVILFVGRLVEGKRPEDAIKAVHRLSRRMDVQLWIVGEGPLRPELEAIADDEVVEFLGRVPYDQMPEVYRSGDLLLLPSRAEGMPRSVLEAFSSGIPAVTNDLDHIAGLVREAGRTVPTGDIEGYANAIEEVLTGASEEMDPREVALERYQWQDTVRRTTAVLESIR